MLRLIIAIILEAIYFFITLPFGLIGLLLGLINKKIQYKIGQFIVVGASWLVYHINGAQLTVTGQDLIPKDQTVLFVGNHKSLIDIPLLLMHTQKRIAFVAKDSLKNVPPINLWMVFIGCLFLDRTNLRKGAATIKQGINKLKEGHSLVIFPEGTRSPDEEMLEFKRGSLKLASKANVLVVPFAIKGTNEIFEDHGFKFRKWPVMLAFGQAIDINALDDETKKNPTPYVQNIVEELRKTMK